MIGSDRRATRGLLRRPRIVILLTVITAMFAASCSSGTISGGSPATTAAAAGTDQSSSAGSASGGSQATTSAALGDQSSGSATDKSSASGPADSISVTTNGAYLLYAPLFLAAAKGYYKQQNLDAHINFVDSGPTAIAALLSNDSQVALISATHAWRSDVSGRNVMIIGANDGQNALTLVISKAAYEKGRLSAVMPVKQRIQGLKGLTFGVRSETSLDGASLHAALEYGGLAGGDVKYVTLTKPSALVAALTNGQIDGFISGAPFPEQVVASGNAVEVLDMTKGELPPLDGVTTTVYMAAPGYIKASPGVVQRFMNAIAMAQRYLALHPDEAAQALHATTDFQSYPLDLMQQQFGIMAKYKALAPDPKLSLDALEKGRFLLDAALGSKSTLDFSTTFTNQFAGAAATADSTTSVK